MTSSHTLIHMHTLVPLSDGYAAGGGRGWEKIHFKQLNFLSLVVVDVGELVRTNLPAYALDLARQAGSLHAFQHTCLCLQ